MIERDVEHLPAMPVMPSAVVLVCFRILGSHWLTRLGTNLGFQTDHLSQKLGIEKDMDLTIGTT